MKLRERTSIVVPCYNEREHIEGVVRGVLGPLRSPAVLEMLVVDGGSNDGTVEVLRRLAGEFSDLRVLTNPDRDIPKAMNIGVRAAHGDIIVRMDAHARYPPDYIERLLGRLSSSPGAGNVGGAWDVLPANDSLEAHVVARVSASRFGVGSALYRVGHRDVTDTDTVPFGCFPRSVFDSVGLYDEQLVRNEDDELNARIHAAGFRIVLDPSIRIGYFCRPTVAKLGRMFFQYGYFKPLVVLKTRSLTSVRQLAPPALLMAITGLGLGSMWSPWSASALIVLSVVYLSFIVVGALCVRTYEPQMGVTGTLLSVACFATVHAMYGLGYVRGVLDFVLLRRHRRSRRLAAAVTR